MVELNVDQQKALALARARRRKAEAQNSNLNTELQARTPFTATGNERGDDLLAYGQGKTSPLAVKKEVIAAGGPDERTFMEKYNSHQPTLADTYDTVVGLGKGIVNAGTSAIKGKVAEGEFINDRINEVENPIVRGAATGLHAAVNPVGWLADQAGSMWAGSTDKGAGTAAVEQTLPRMEPEKGTVQEVFEPMGELGAAVAVGNKAAAAGRMVPASGYAARIARYMGSFALGETAASQVMDNKTETAVTGKDKYIPSIAGEVTDEDDAATAHMKRATAIAQDAVTTGLLAEGAQGVGKILGYGGSLFKRAWQHKNRTAIQNQFLQAILEKAAKIPEGASKEVEMAAYKDIADYVNQNSKIATSFGDAGVKDLNETRDTISVILSKLDMNNAEDRAIANQLESMRASAMSGAPALQGAMEAPRRNLEGALDQVTESRGGRDAIEGTKDTLVGKADQQIMEGQVPVGRAQYDLANAEKGAEDALRTDKVYGPKLEAAEKSGVNLDINKESLDRQTDIFNKAKEARAVDVEARNKAYQTIADLDAPADMDSFVAVYNNKKDFLPPELVKEMDALIAKSDGSFGYLNNVIRPRLSDRITDLYGQSKGTIAKDVREIRDNITGTQLDTLASTRADTGQFKRGRQDVVDAVDAANKANKDYSAKWKDGLGQDLRMNEKAHARQPMKQAEGGRAKILAAIRDPNRRESVQQLRNIIGDEGGDAIDDVIFAEGAKNVVGKIGSGKKISEMELDELVKPLQEMAGSMSDAGRKRAEDFLTSLRDKKLTAENLKEQVKVLQAQADATEKSIRDGHLGKFMAKDGEAVSSGTDTFKKLLANPQSGKDVDKIVADIGDDEAARKGLEAAWSSTAKDMLDKGGTEKVAGFSDEFLENGKKIFKDNPHIVDAMKQLRDRADDISKAGKNRQFGGLPYRQNDVDAHGATNSIITFVWGVLNPTAARIRLINNDLLKRNSSGDIARDVGDVLLSNSEEFGRMASEWIAKKQRALSPAQKKMVYQWVNKMGWYGPGNAVNADTDAATSR